jgi:hypothetical protein
MRAGRSTGSLVLNELANECDVFVTTDRNLPFQRRLRQRPFATMILRARSNRLADLLPLLPKLLEAIDHARPGDVVEVG